MWIVWLSLAYKFKKTSLSSITKSQSQTKLCPVVLFKSNNEKEKNEKKWEEHLRASLSLTLI